MKRPLSGLVLLLLLGSACRRSGPEASVPPRPTAAPPVDMTIDLATTSSDRPVDIEEPGLRQVRLRLANRAPGAHYRWSWDGGQRMTEVREAGPAELGGIAAEPPCDAVSSAALGVLRASEEAAVAASAASLRRVLDGAGTCPEPLLQKARSSLDLTGPAVANISFSDLRRTVLTVERLDPATQAVRRRWIIRFEAPRAKVAGWTYQTEEDWIVAETSARIVRMLASRGPADKPSRIEVKSTSTLGDRYQVTLDLAPGTAPLVKTLEAPEYLWSPATYEPLALALLPAGDAAPRTVPGPSLLPALLEPKAAVLEEQNQRLSLALAKSVLDPALHEQAALLLGTMAWREKAGRFRNRRPFLCAMAGHLAIARALRAGARPATDGEDAELLLLTFAGRSAPALDGIRAHRKSARGAEAAWLGALEMAITDDWRILPASRRASLLERLAGFEARVVAVDGLAAMDYLRQSGSAEPITDWHRRALQNPFAVEVGNTLVPSAFPLEIEEAAGILGATDKAGAGGTDLLQRLVAGRGRTEDVSTQVIPASMWASQFERHLMSAAEFTNQHFLNLGLPEEAERFRAMATERLSGLTLFALIQHMWTVAHPPKAAAPTAFAAPGSPPAGASVEEACGRAVNLLQTRPELVSVVVWEWIDNQCRRVRGPAALPPPERWFARACPRGTAYDAGARLPYGMLGTRLELEELEELHRLAPLDFAVLTSYLGRRNQRTLTGQEYAAAMGPLTTYNVNVMRRWAQLERDNFAEYRRISERLCQVSPDDCGALGRELSMHGLEAEAARSYARAFAEGRDRVRASYMASWLVDYYYDHAQPARALAVAREAADVGSWVGLEAMARLLERQGRLPQAEEQYREMAKRYDEKTTLPCFYLRREMRRPGGTYRQAADEARPKLFPKGLRKVTAAGLTPVDVAGTGVTIPVAGPSAELAALGLLARDRIVAEDGYQVDDQAQYECVQSFRDDSELALVVVRRDKVIEVKGPFRRVHYGSAAVLPPPVRSPAAAQ